jgi:hypothetical protein
MEKHSGEERLQAKKKKKNQFRKGKASLRGK